MQRRKPDSEKPRVGDHSYDIALQRRVLARIRSRLADGGLLVIGSHEHLPPGSDEWRVVGPTLARLAS